MSLRSVASLSTSSPTMEGAGVRLRRAFGFGKTSEFDPFLLFDDFRGDTPDDYKAGFPWHPHRGIETITYVLAGSVEHRDSLGNRGLLGAGDLQWMTAGSGILHQEMPQGSTDGRMHGFQLWANLPSGLKMTKPRYQDIPGTEIRILEDDDGSTIRVLAGSYKGIHGGVEGIAADPCYFDISIPAHTKKRLPIPIDRHAFAYIFAGEGHFESASLPQGVLVEDLLTDQTYRDLAVANHHLLRFDRGDEIIVKTGTQGLRFLLASGKPLGEPVAWHGPIVMNTDAEIRQAMRDLQNGTFIQQ